MTDTVRTDVSNGNLEVCPMSQAMPEKGFDKQLEIVTLSEIVRKDAPSVVSSFHEHAAASPDALAVAAAEGVLSYRELDERANQLAHRLLTQGVTRGTVVGLLVTRSLSLAVGALGIMKAGGAYLPLDPEIPAERLAFLLQDAGASVLITESRAAQKFELNGDYKVLNLDRDGTLRTLPRTKPETMPAPDDLAYVIYTSGSTGTPKGVEITHRALMNLVEWHQKAFNITASDRASHLAALGFDAAVWELWPYLSAGASMHFAPDSVRQAPEDLRDWLVSNKITMSFVPTPLAEFLIALEWPADTALRTMLTGGDTLHSHPSPRLPFQLFNNYGPTECTVVTTSGLVPATDNGDGLPRIGWPIQNMQIHILNENLERVTDGEPGELFIGGAGVAQGYRNRPDLTKERFIPDPFRPDSGGRLYRTGDLVRLCPDGQLAFLGRVDEQIKIAGYRIEPNEIVHALEKHADVQSSVVLAREDAPGTKKLVAYVVPEPGADLTDDKLRAFLDQWLPPYMVPSVFVRIDRLPLTTNGKVDRATLPVPSAENILRAAMSAPGNAVEQRLAGILSKLLGLDKLGLEDNFFTLGGHSLLGTQLIGRIRDAFGVELSLRTVFDAPTIAELSAQIEQLLVAKLSAMSEEEAGRLLSQPGAVQTEERAL